MNVGPTKDGKIIPLFEERLRQLGQWLNVNGESIYSSKPWSHQNDTMTRNIWYILENLVLLLYIKRHSWTYIHQHVSTTTDILK
jgi:hypothetical protein